MTHVTCRLTAKNRDQRRNPTLGNRVWATFTFSYFKVGWEIPPKCSLPPGGFGPPPNTWFLWAYSSGTSIGSALLTQLVVVTIGPTDRHTDHATSAAIARIRALCACDAALNIVTVLGLSPRRNDVVKCCMLSSVPNVLLQA